MDELNEEKKESGNKRCYGCGSYDCYYTKGYMCFSREKVGYCNKHKKITLNQDTCEGWRSNQFRRRRLSTLSVKALNETIANLTEITNIITEDIKNKHIEN